MDAENISSEYSSFCVSNTVSQDRLGSVCNIIKENLSDLKQLRFISHFYSMSITVSPKGFCSVIFTEGGSISGSMIAKGKKKGALVNCALALSHISLAKATCDHS